MQTVLKQVISAATGTLVGTPLATDMMLTISLQAVTTGTLAGTLIIEASNDITSNPTAPGGGSTPPTNFNQIATVAIAGSPANFLIPKLDVCYAWLRVTFTASTGIGTISATLKGLQL